jgi:hypothetical protein
MQEKADVKEPPLRRARESYTTLNDKTLIDEEDFDMDLSDSDEEIIKTQVDQNTKIASARKFQSFLSEQVQKDGRAVDPKSD